MYHFFVDSRQIGEEYIDVTGADVNHIKNVLRLGVGTHVILCDRKGMDYHCVIDALTNEVIRCKILSKGKSMAELPVDVTLIQGAPKQDKMELIVQKTVELGVNAIIPIMMKRSIVKYDGKKAAKKLTRWQSIAESAAKQSKRGIIPQVNEIRTFNELLTELKYFDKVIVPYENEHGMQGTREVLGSITANDKVAVVIGPEGGFDSGEIEALVAAGGETITLGNRILRTETAGLVCLAMIGYQLEEV